MYLNSRENLVITSEIRYRAYGHEHKSTLYVHLGEWRGLYVGKRIGERVKDTEERLSMYTTVYHPALTNEMPHLYHYPDARADNADNSSTSF